MNRKSLLWTAIAGVLACSTAYAADERGRDGQVNIIYWQAPSTLNAYLSGGTKDTQAASMVLEPLARYDENGELTAWLAESVPTVENGGVAEDLTSITWVLKEGLLWSDGSPVTAADAVFTAEYCMHPEGGCAQLKNFGGVTNVEAIDDRTIKVNFEAPTPFPYGPLVGVQSPILQKAQFQDCLGPKAPECTEQNFGPIGTGAFVVEDFRPNDVIILAANENYREEGKPAFAKVNFKGGGDAASAARAVLETGEFDYAWNLQLAPEVLEDMQEGGKGEAIEAFGTLVERIMVNHTNPDPSLGADDRSVVRPHPSLDDPAVYKALSLAIDRPLLVEIGYGKAGRVSCNLVPAPQAYASDTFSCDVQDIDAANKMLDEAGWARGGDGVRAKDGVRLNYLFQSSTNAVRQDFQALIKQWWSEIGVEAELRNVSGSVFFGGDPGSPDTMQKFYADVEMYANNFDGTDPQSYLGQYTCDKAPGPDSQWQGENISRFCMEEYDTLYKQLERTAETTERHRISKELNDMIVSNGALIPLVHRGRVSGKSNSLGGVVLNVWDSELWNVADWYRVN
ncbi:peptide ABC transporter substrate-binding protein [Granulosicoccus antarcticus]|uniref:Glutathione-binding protein GsiB n=1 Tax=Granulosicoccus antarcticus IMCC3135 TaxID=1192854 RepID=A0A2Z2NW92_9GAMM|nr:peptide ABC transporter substrate-binding protein [Granulosicoccus antarcticus]ASJ75712.1 Glutathione-binding protein GsiB [Granulosicoccus antarcticus IMCC3135]